MRVMYMCKKLKISIAGMLFLSLFQYLLHAQASTAEKNIIILKTSVGDVKTPEKDIKEPLAEIETKAKQVFAGLSRFSLVPLGYTLTVQDIPLLLGKLKTYAGGKTEVPATVQVGETAFPRSDFSLLLKSYLIVIPVLTAFTIEELHNQGNQTKYKVSLAASYTIVNTEKATVVSNIPLESIGYDADKDRAVQDAVEDIPIQLTYEVRSLDIFSLEDRIVELMDPDVAIRLGKEKGVTVGDEYAIMSSDQEDGNGQVKSRESGLIIIHNIEEKVSIGRVIYSDGPLTAGTPVKEIPRVGLEMIPYAHTEINFADLTYTGAAGLKFVITKGFFVIQPVFCFEVVLYPFERLQDVLPVRAYGGLDFNLYLGRFQLSGMVAVGTEIITALSPSSRVDGFEFSYMGLAGIANIGYLITRDVKIILDLGYQAWFPLNDNYVDYEGWVAGLGVGLKF
jgi:hypothetical protein